MIRTIGEKIYTKLRASYYFLYSVFDRYAKDIDSNNPILLDTNIRSTNSGDAIIMHFAELQLSDIWDTSHLDRIANHGITSGVNTKQRDSLKILCGTNALSTCGDINCRIALPTNPKLYKDSVLLLATGLSNVTIRQSFSRQAAATLRYILSKKYIHSVRDSHTAAELRTAGIDNVINTSCITMWKLTPDFCMTIPRQKATDVLTTITDYGFDPQLDGYMLKVLQKHYRKVYVWIQGREDEEKINSLRIPGLILVFGGFPGLQSFCNGHTDFDYIGTRLHCGIYCLNQKIRSMIIAIDNRADDIHHDTNLPTLRREDLRQNLANVIENERITNIHIPEENIRVWKNQFSQRR